MSRHFVAAIVLLIAESSASTLLAQHGQPAPQPPPPLFIKLAGPPGTKVTVYRGEPKGRSFDLPCVMAFRPGYRYRLELTRQIGTRSERLAVYPSLDVFGSLRLSGGMRACDYPATINFTDEDFASIRGGSMVSKVIVLERPETALPIATTCDSPLELTVPPNCNPLLEAQDRGRPLAVLQMGERVMTQEELACVFVPGTILLPGENVLPPPRDPPCLPWMCYPIVDPRSGLPNPADEICFHDGGDIGLRAGITGDGKLVGLDASDTVAQYTDSRGNLKIAVSNKVCLCVPRFLLIRTAISPIASTLPTNLGDTRVLKTPAASQANVAPWEKHRDVELAVAVGRQKASGIVNLQDAQVVGRVESLVIYASADGTGHVTGMCPPPEPKLIEKPLVIIKWPDKCDPKLGEIVTFYIRYKNEGQLPITGVVVSDSLTARLEYVRNSARADRDALFTMTPNEVDSTVLRWEVTGSLLPGQMGTVTFQARIR